MSKGEKTQEIGSNIPYNGDMEILEKILDDLKNTGKDGISLKTLWDNIGETKNPNKSYTLTMIKYLNLVDSDGIKIWLTDLGNSIRLYPKDKRSKILIEKLPQIYLTMAKWLKHESGEMAVNDIKAKFIETFGSPKSNVLFDRAIYGFLNYCKHIGLLTYTGKGSTAKATLTEFGKKTLDSPITEDKEPPKGSDLGQEGAGADDTKSRIELPKDAKYPIKIITKDRGVFDFDVKSMTDWAVIDAVIKSIKEDWEKTHQKPKEGDSKGK